jgi:hypothetical protein
MSTRNLPGGVKAVRRVRLGTLPPSVSRLSRKNVGASTSHNSLGFHGMLQGELYLFLHLHSVDRKVSLRELLLPFNTLKSKHFLLHYFLGHLLFPCFWKIETVKESDTGKTNGQKEEKKAEGKNERTTQEI